MTIEDIRKYRNADPFLPFRLLLADGRKLLVRGPEKIGWGAGGSSLGVYTHGDAFVFLNVAEITDVKTVPRRTKKR